MKRAAALVWFLAAGPAFAGGKPDLRMLSVSGPTEAFIGTNAVSVDLSFRLSQTGGSPTHPTIGFYLSADTNITTSDISLGWLPAVPISPGQTLDWPFQAVIPPTTTAGRYYLGAIADTLNVVAESSETNNTAVGNAIQIAIDMTPPQIAISGVTEGAITNAVPLQICYTATDIHLANSDAVLDGIPFYGCTLAFAAGDHTLRIIATDTAGNTASTEVHFTIDLGLPSVVVEAPAAGALVGATTPISVFASDVYGVAGVTANGAALTLGGDGRYHGNAPVPAEGANDLVVTVTDLAGNVASTAVAIVRDTLPPTLTVTAPVEGAQMAGDATVIGSVSDASAVVVRVNGASVIVGAGGAFSRTLQLPPGEQDITVQAVDTLSNASTVVRHVHVALPAPSIATYYCYDGAGNMKARLTCLSSQDCSSQCP